MLFPFRVAIAVCSGNLELPLMRQCIDRALTLDNRMCKFSLLLSDCPGDITKLLEILAREDVRYFRIMWMLLAGHCSEDNTMFS